MLDFDARAVAAATPTDRDRYVDLLRAGSILAVVTGHWLAVTVTVHDGQVSGVNALVRALQVLPWTRPLTWLFQVMPVFFLVGGYVNAASWSSHQRRGGDGTSWVRSRMFRLLQPTAIFVVILAVGTGLGRAVGFNPSIVAGSAWVASISLWFMVVYIAVVALAPLMISLQRRWGHARTIALLVGWVAVADLSQLLFGLSFLESTNFVLGWLAVHQLGVAWRDGALTRDTSTARLLVTGGLLSLLLLTGPGPYAVSMFGPVGSGMQNLAPPTLALLALAVAQTGLLLWLRGPVDRLLTRPRIWAAVIAVNAMVLTIYLWQTVPVVIVSVALVLTGVLPQYPLGSVEFMLFRLPWLLALTIVLIVLVAVFARWERPRPPGTQPALLDESPWAKARLVLGVCICLLGLSGLVQTRFAGVVAADVPIVELTALAIGLLLVGFRVPIIKRQRARP